MQILKEFDITPKNLQLYELAFTHSSYANEHGKKESYERLEYLGDAVFDLIISEVLYNRYPELNEGQLTRKRANYVCKKAHYTYAMELGLDKYLKLSVKEQLSNREKDSIVSDLFESFLGALYLDQGLENTKDFVTKAILPHITNNDTFFYDHKTKLKQLCDRRVYDIRYELIKETGEPHNKLFTMAAVINGKEYGTGTGGSKKEAEQKAAKMVLRDISMI